MGKVPIKIYVLEELKAELEKVAKQDNRSLNNFVNKVLIEYLEMQEDKDDNLD